MRVFGLRVLKNKSSKYVRLAERGETVLVTDRDRVVAELVPPDRSRSPLLAGAMRQGLITPPALPSTDAPPRKPRATLRQLQQELSEDRSGH
jgi:antitoxin (DNA-binding transcriptional repressor) of toxin-antitoxin stability system